MFRRDRWRRGAPAAGRVLGLLVVLTVALLGPGGSDARAATLKPLVGIADQKTGMFTDPIFTRLGAGHARVVVPWDAMDGGFQRDEFFTWMAAARAANVTPLITFGHSRRGARKRISPSPTVLRRQFLRIRAKFPWATEFSTWNEPNHCSQPVCRQPELAARYFDAMVRACKSCTILGAEVLDTPNLGTWVRRFLKRAVNEPKVWALHNYVDANRFKTSGTRTMLKETKGQLWFTETGGIVKRRTKNKIPLDESESHAAEATRWLFDRLVPLSPRVRRVYLYHWNSVGPVDTWDSALIDLKGRPRSAFRVVQARIQRGQVKVSRRSSALLGTAPTP